MVDTIEGGGWIGRHDDELPAQEKAQEGVDGRAANRTALGEEEREDPLIYPA